MEVRLWHSTEYGRVDSWFFNIVLKSCRYCLCEARIMSSVRIHSPQFLEGSEQCRDPSDFSSQRSVSPPETEKSQGILKRTYRFIVTFCVHFAESKHQLNCRVCGQGYARLETSCVFFLKVVAICRNEFQHGLWAGVCADHLGKG